MSVKQQYKILSLSKSQERGGGESYGAPIYSDEEEGGHSLYSIIEVSGHRLICEIYTGSDYYSGTEAKFWKLNPEDILPDKLEWEEDFPKSLKDDKNEVITPHYIEDVDDTFAEEKSYRDIRKTVYYLAWTEKSLIDYLNSFDFNNVLDRNVPPIVISSLNLTIPATETKGKWEGEKEDIIYRISKSRNGYSVHMIIRCEGICRQSLKFETDKSFEPWFSHYEAKEKQDEVLKQAKEIYNHLTNFLK